MFSGLLFPAGLAVGIDEPCATVVFPAAPVIFDLKSYLVLLDEWLVRVVSLVYTIERVLTVNILLSLMIGLRLLLKS